jgi:hypothetical protein
LFRRISKSCTSSRHARLSNTCLVDATRANDLK